MAIAIAPLLTAGLTSLQQGKIEKAQGGSKSYTKPKTFIGKLIGGVSGRTAAAEATTMYKNAPVSDQVINSMSTYQRQNVPLSGGLSFGGEAAKKTYLPFYLAAAVVAIFYFMRGKKGPRRKY